MEIVTENVQSPAANALQKLVFIHFPGFAKFIRENYLLEYVKESLRLSYEMDLPILKHLTHLSEEQLLELGIPAHTDFFTCAEENRLMERLERTAKTWESDQMGILGKDDIASEDITLGSYVRKQTLVKFIPYYTDNLDKAFALMREIDMHEAVASDISLKTYIRILQGRINEHAHFIESITNTTPGVIYVFDLIEKKELYSNNKVTDILGFTPEEMLERGSQIMYDLMHPDDIAMVMGQQEELRSIKDGEISVIEYRTRNKAGEYKWMRNYRSIFKRDKEGKPLQIIGISLDVNDEKRKEIKLKTSEEQLLEAQQLADIGSYEHDLVNDTWQISPQVLKIVEMTEWVPADVRARIHPADRPKAMQVREIATRENGSYDIEYRYQADSREKILWARGKVELKDGRQILKGTLMDVTDRHYMIQNLQRSEYLYKQAQAMSHIGNWTWDLLKNKLTWSDELYRIYELEPGSEISNEFIASMNHPEDAERIISIMQEARQTHQPYDFHYRIVLKGGNQKIVHARGEVLVDEHNVPFKLLGTVQDVTERQGLIEGLQKSDELYKQAQALSHIGNWEWDLVSGNLVWSNEIYKIFGLEPGEELIREKILEQRHPDDAHMIAIAEEAIANCLPYDITYRIIARDGTVKYVNSIAQISEVNNGKVIRLIGTIQDVTEKQTLIADLQKSEELYKQAQAISHVGNWEWDIKADKISWSDELYRLFGLDPAIENISYEQYQYHLHPQDRDKMNQVVGNCLNTHEPYEIMHRTILEDGSVRYLLGKGEMVLDAEGKPAKLVGTSQDITRQYLTEQQVKANDAFIRKIANTTPSLIASYNVNTGQYTYINTAFEKILGYDPQMIFDKGVPFFMDILHPDDAAALIDKNTRAMEEANANPPTDGLEPVVEFKYRMKHKDGRYRWFHTYGTIFDRDADGKILHVLNVSVDITDQEQAEQELFRKNIQLQQSNNSLEEFAYVASHDLKEPLRKIATFGDRLIHSNYESLNEDGKVYLNKIIDAARRMQTMVSDLLSISIISSNKYFEFTNLNSIFDEVLRTLEFKIEEKKAVVTTDSLPVVSIVPSQFRQLFQNLLSNSMKFSKPGIAPEIKLEASFISPSAVVEYNLVKAKRYLKLIFSDNGIGFENEFSNKIFTIFQRLHGKSEYEGNGIGLAICKKIVENHSGVVFADGEPGLGATFTIIIPA